MTQLSIFSAQECELLISLPYRAGVFVSEADDVDSEDDDEREMKVLEETLKAVAVLHEQTPLIGQIFKETLRLKFEWPRWHQKAFAISEDAQAAVSLLKSKGSEGAAKAYRAALMEVATTVARAYGEFGQFDEPSADKGFLGGMVSKIVGGFSSMSKDDQNHPMNVSASEDSALAELAAALKI